MITCIRNADWVIAWDTARGQHIYLRGADIAFAGDRIVQVGGTFEGECDQVIDGRRLCVMPGLVNVHTHLMSECLGRGVIEELGNPNLYMSGLYDQKAVFLATNMTYDTASESTGLNAASIGAKLAIAELLKSGVTTVVDLSVEYEGWIDTLASTGIRAYVAPMYRQARWKVPTGHRLDYDWDERAGIAQFRRALELVDLARTHSCGRLDGMVAPAQVDTCTPELLRDSLTAARDRRMRLSCHCGQSVVEFQEMIRRHGRTSVQWLEEIGLLGPDVLLAHAIFLDHHSWVHWSTRRDISLLAASGTSIAHCPLVFSRYGQMMESLGAYLKAGINVGLGTDTEPHNMLEEMRIAVTLGRIASENIRGIELSDVFNVATIGGARALGRDDLGRLAVGAKADIVLLDLDCPQMMPARDPLRSLVFTAADRAVRDVYVDGRQVFANGTPIAIDLLATGRAAEIIQAGTIANVPNVDYLKRTAEQISPFVLPIGGL